MAYFIRCRVSLPPHPINHLFNLLLVSFHHLPQAVYHLPLGCEFIHNTALDFNITIVLSIEQIISKKKIEVVFSLIFQYL